MILLLIKFSFFLTSLLASSPPTNQNDNQPATEVLNIHETAAVGRATFDRIPLDPFALIASRIPAFPVLGNLNRAAYRSYNECRSWVLWDRLGGFEAGEDYQALGMIVQMDFDYKSVGDLIELAHLILIHPDQEIFFIRLRLLIFHLKNLTEADLRTFMAVQPLAHDIMLNLLEVGNVKDISAVLPFLFYAPEDHNRIARIRELIPFIVPMHEHLLPAFGQFFALNFDAAISPQRGLSVIIDYLKLFLFKTVPPTVDELNAFLTQITAVGFEAFLTSYILQQLFHLIHTPEQSTLYRAIFDFLPHGDLQDWRMALAVVGIEEWPVYGTWPQHFNFPQEIDEFADFDHLELMRTCLVVAFRLGRVNIVRDICDQWTAPGFPNNQFAISVSRDTLTQIPPFGSEEETAAYAILAFYFGNGPTYNLIRESYPDLQLTINNNDF